MCSFLICLKESTIILFNVLEMYPLFLRGRNLMGTRFERGGDSLFR